MQYKTDKKIKNPSNQFDPRPILPDFGITEHSLLFSIHDVSSYSCFKNAITCSRVGKAGIAPR